MYVCGGGAGGAMEATAQGMKLFLSLLVRVLIVCYLLPPMAREQTDSVLGVLCPC